MTIQLHELNSADEVTAGDKFLVRQGLEEKIVTFLAICQTLNIPVSGISNLGNQILNSETEEQIKTLLNIDDDTVLTTDQVKDIVGMFLASTGSNINITYNSQDRTVSFSVPEASQTTVGAVELATDAETEGRSLDNKAVTPAGLDAALQDLSVSDIQGLTAQLNSKLDTGSNADTATRLQNSITFSLSGDATGSVSMDGGSDVSLEVTVDPSQHNHEISQITSLQTALSGKQDNIVVQDTLDITGLADGTIIAVRS